MLFLFGCRENVEIWVVFVINMPEISNVVNSGWT